MKTLYTLIDNLDYVKNNCYQHQMSKALEERFDVKYISLTDLKPIPIGAHVLSRLKLRTIDRQAQRLKYLLGDRKIMVYDQDPWEAFFSDGDYNGAYKRIFETLNVSTFLNISHWWRDIVIDLGMPSKFVQVWTLPEYCKSEPIPWEKREHDAVFCGTLYPRRKAFFDELALEGVNVKILPTGLNFTNYLDVISRSKVAIRSERVDWTIDAAGGKLHTHKANALWKRDIETVAQGCFSMRDLDDEAQHWNISSMPLIIPFTTAREAAENYRNIMNMHNDEANEIITKSVKFVHDFPGWSLMCDVIEGML